MEDRARHAGRDRVHQVPGPAGLGVGGQRALRHVLALDDVPPPIADEAREALAALPGDGSVVTGPAVTGPAVTGSAVTG